MTVVDIPSRSRIEPGSANVPPTKFPETSSSLSVNPDEVASDVVSKFNAALSKKDYQGVANLFREDGYWRDHLCASWDFHTISGREKIANFLKGSQISKIEIERSSALRAPHIGPVDAFGEVTGIEFYTTVTTEVGTGAGITRLLEKDGEWKIFIIFTSLQGLKGYEEGLNTRRPKGAEHGQHQERQNWQERRAADTNYESKEPAVVIIGIYLSISPVTQTIDTNASIPGAGQAGLTAAARLKMLNVDTLIIDNEDRIGDSWRRRYRQLVLHDPVWFDHMPYIPFPEHWPIFTPKDKLAEFFECYVKMLELNVWTKTNLKSASWSDEKKQWTIVFERKKEDGSLETRTLHPHHVIQATGHSGKKNQPTFKGMESFKGDRICHSSEFPGANPNSKGKKAVVIGSCNSGHDIAQDYYEKGYDITMVQRSSTCVVSSDPLVNIALKGLYEENGPPVEDADLYLWSFPSTLFKTQQSKVTQVISKEDAPVIEGLEKAGFKVDKGPDDAGLLIKYLQRGGGYYINVGASQMIADGKIKIKQGQEITEILPHALRFADGTELEADEIILATGYQNMRTQARIIFGDEVADRLGDIWGWDSEGEMRTIWRRSGHPGFWFMGGNLALCRYYSRLLALQIKAVEEGLTV